MVVHSSLQRGVCKLPYRRNDMTDGIDKSVVDLNIC